MLFKHSMVALLSLAAVMPLFGQTRSALPPSAEDKRLGLVKRASALLQRKVVDERDRNLGKTSDLVLDLPNARVPMVLVLSGGEEVTPVPSSVFSEASVETLVMNAEKKVFASAPRVARAGSLDLLNDERADASRRHFGQTRPPGPEGAVSKLSSAAGLLGVPVCGQNNEALGTLKDIMVDLPMGRIVYFVIEPAADASAAETFYVVPPSQLRTGDSAGFLVLSADRGRFLAGPRFQSEFWNDLAFPAMAAAVRQHYGPSQKSLTEAQRPSEPKPAPGAAPGGPARSDQEITQAVLAEIVHQARGFLSVKIGVTTVNGRVILSGNIKSDGQRRQIVSAAERVVGKANVENRLQGDSKGKTAKL